MQKRVSCKSIDALSLT